MSLKDTQNSEQSRASNHTACEFEIIKYDYVDNDEFKLLHIVVYVNSKLLIFNSEYSEILFKLLNNVVEIDCKFEIFKFEYI